VGTAGGPSVPECTGVPCQLCWRGLCGTEGQVHEPAGDAREHLRQPTPSLRTTENSDGALDSAPPGVS
jgi:hypothetical protein